MQTKLRETLLRCGPFNTGAALRSTFTDARIYPWRDHIPDAPSRAERVDALIDALHDQSNPQGENALVLFLRVLADRTHPGNACHHDLAQLTHELERALVIPSEGSAATGAEEPPIHDSKTEYHIHIKDSQIGVIGDGTEIEGGIHFDSPQEH